MLFVQGGSKSLNQNRPFHFEDVLTFPVDSYEVVLILDVREFKTRNDQSAVCDTLRSHGVKAEVRSLRLGDMLWIARLKEHMYPEIRLHCRECVLDYIVERKRLDDLCVSIKDGRYDEQKVCDVHVSFTRLEA
jgi:crossover junction endonuclease MUS81